MERKVVMLSKGGINYRYNRNALTDKCIVLDADETLVFTMEEPDALSSLGIYTRPDCCDLRQRIYHRHLENVGTKRGEGTVMELCGIVRPALTKFLAFCLKYFRVVAIWSAGLPEYVEDLTDFLFRDLEDPHLVYTRTDCAKRNGQHEKPLAKMMEEFPGIMTLESTFILDDNTYSFEWVNPDNAILIPHYRPVMSIEGLREHDPSLDELMKWLMQPQVMHAKDVRKLPKSNIFSMSDLSKHNPIEYGDYIFLQRYN